MSNDAPFFIAIIMAVIMMIVGALFGYYSNRSRMVERAAFPDPGGRRRRKQDRLPSDVEEMQLGDLVPNAPRQAGVRPQKKMECPLCGARVDTWASACPNCGAQFEQEG